MDSLLRYRGIHLRNFNPLDLTHQALAAGVDPRHPGGPAERSLRLTPRQERAVALAGTDRIAFRPIGALGPEYEVLAGGKGTGRCVVSAAGVRTSPELSRSIGLPDGEIVLIGADLDEARRFLAWYLPTDLRGW